ncbi:MAG: hypothetical protein JXB88_25865 [Spirochaetales bacterium]|nr:hypothetical protein [Spirochaetales bacterium]
MTKIHYWILGIGIVLLTLFFSCAVTESENVATSGIWASYAIEHQSDTKIVARATLRVGGPLGTILEMSSGEHITCNGVTLTWAYFYYHTEFSTPASGNTYTFVFHREEETISTVVVVPDMPESVSTTPSVIYNEWEPLTINWTAGGSGDLVEVQITGTDIYPYTQSTISDTGSVIVNDTEGSGVISIDNAVVSPLSVVVKRYRTDSVNSVYQGGGTRGEHWAPAVTITDFQPKLTLHITISPAYTGSVTSDGIYSEPVYSGEYRKYRVSEEVIITAEPIAGWAFDNWTGDVETAENPYTIVGMITNMSVTANFIGSK